MSPDGPLRPEATSLGGRALAICWFREGKAAAGLPMDQCLTQVGLHTVAKEAA